MGKKQGTNQGGREVEGRGGGGRGVLIPGVPMGSDDETGYIPEAMGWETGPNAGSAIDNAHAST